MAFNNTEEKDVSFGPYTGKAHVVPLKDGFQVAFWHDNPTRFKIGAQGRIGTDYFKIAAMPPAPVKGMVVLTVAQ